MSLAAAKPSRDVSTKLPCRSSAGAQAMLWTTPCRTGMSVGELVDGGAHRRVAGHVALDHRRVADRFARGVATRRRSRSAW